LLAKNFIANVLSRLWNVGSNYLFIPLYLMFLGVDGYAFIGFYVVLAGVVGFADLGMTATTTREIAVLSDKPNSSSEKKDLIKTFEILYLMVIVIIFMTIFAFAPLIAKYWIKSIVFNVDDVVYFLRLIALCLALQMPTGMYLGGLFGQQKQVSANALLIINGMLRGGCSIFLLWWWLPDLEFFFYGQILANLIFFCLSRYTLLASLQDDGSLTKGKFKINIIKKHWRYASGVAAISVVGLVLNQADKVLVSSQLAFEFFGYYSIAFTVSMVPILLANLVAVTIYPRLVLCVESGNDDNLLDFYYKSCQFTAFIMLPISLTFLFLNQHFIYSWTGLSEVAIRIDQVGFLLLLAQTFQAIIVLPFNLALANGRTKPSFYIGLSSIVFFVPLMFFLIEVWQEIGAGVSWVIFSAIMLPINIYFLHKGNRTFDFIKAHTLAFALPIIPLLAFIFLAYKFSPDPFISRIDNLYFILICGVLAQIIAAMSLPVIRGFMVQKKTELVNYLGVS
jgi:O-antigen/teichoic acid export membrane protein